MSIKQIALGLMTWLSMMIVSGIFYALLANIWSCYKRDEATLAMIFLTVFVVLTILFIYAAVLVMP